MKALRGTFLLIALLLVFVMGVCLGAYTSHTNPDLYRRMALFRGVIPGQPLKVAELQTADEDISKVSDEVDILEQAESLLALVEPEVTSREGDRMTLTNLKGDQLKVTLLDLNSEFVQIRRERDGREFPVRLDALVEPDRLAILAWQEENRMSSSQPDEIDFDELFQLFDE